MSRLYPRLPRGTAAVFALAAAALAGFPANADAPSAVPGGDFTPEMSASVARGLQWLANHQHKDGSFGSHVTVATTSMAGLAFLANGNVPGRGRYADNVKNAVKYLLMCQQRRGKSGYITEPGQGGSRMHGHGYATLFLAEVLGMTNDVTEGMLVEDIREAVRRGVEVIEKSQSREGGWYYEPVAGQDEGSVTVTQVQALRSARNAGIGVNKTTIDHAVKYIKRSANPDGGIRYSLTSNAGESSYALTAAGVSVMNYLGEYDMAEIDRGLKYLETAMKGGGNRRNRGSYVSYETFYAALAFYHAGGERWAKAWPQIRGDILRRQTSDGSWADHYGPEFATAFAVTTLQVPNQYLPIFQH